MAVCFWTAWNSCKNVGCASISIAAILIQLAIYIRKLSLVKISVSITTIPLQKISCDAFDHCAEIGWTLVDLNEGVVHVRRWQAGATKHFISDKLIEKTLIEHRVVEVNFGASPKFLPRNLVVEFQGETWML